MSLPSNGITPDVIREMMPPYHLSPDLLEGTFAALPLPPPDASTSWRQAHITRLVEEITALMPADAAQARLASQILIVRELANNLTTRAYAPGATVEQMCRLGRTSAELVRTAAVLERALTRRQQQPVPFFGTVVADEVDIAALDAVWCNDPMRGLPPVAGPRGETGPKPTPASACKPAGDIAPHPAADQPNAAPPDADAEASTAAPSLPARSNPVRTLVPAWRERLADGAPGIPVNAGSPALDAGLGAAPELAV
jgi:hypothetical protein